MRSLMKAVGRSAVAAVVASALLASASISPRLSQAGFSPTQDAAKVELKKEAALDRGPVELRKEAVALPAPAVRVVEVNGAKLDVQFVNAAPALPLDQMTQQMIGRLTPILRAELRTLTSAAEPSPTQRREIAVEGGRALKMVAGNQARAGGNGLAIMRRRAGSATDNARKLIHDAIEAEAKSKLSPEQYARYQKEVAAKAKDRREVLILNVVARLDKVLLLSAEQRDKLSESLRSNGDDQSYPSLEMSDIHERYFPIIPEPQIHPFLTQEQWKTWRDLPKLNFGTIQVVNNGQVDLIEDDDEDLKAALAEEPKK